MKINIYVLTQLIILLFYQCKCKYLNNKIVRRIINILLQIKCTRDEILHILICNVMLVAHYELLWANMNSRTPRHASYVKYKFPQIYHALKMYPSAFYTVCSVISYANDKTCEEKTDLLCSLLVNKLNCSLYLAYLIQWLNCNFIDLIGERILLFISMYAYLKIIKVEYSSSNYIL